MKVSSYRKKKKENPDESFGFGPVSMPPRDVGPILSNPTPPGQRRRSPKLAGVVVPQVQRERPASVQWMFRGNERDNSPRPDPPSPYLVIGPPLEIQITAPPMKDPSFFFRDEKTLPREKTEIRRILRERSDESTSFKTLNVSVALPNYFFRGEEAHVLSPKSRPASSASKHHRRNLRQSSLSSFREQPSLDGLTVEGKTKDVRPPEIKPLRSLQAQCPPDGMEAPGSLALPGGRRLSPNNKARPSVNSLLSNEEYYDHQADTGHFSAVPKGRSNARRPSEHSEVSSDGHSTPSSMYFTDGPQYSDLSKGGRTVLQGNVTGLPCYDHLWKQQVQDMMTFKVEPHTDRHKTPITVHSVLESTRDMLPTPPVDADRSPRANGPRPKKVNAARPGTAAFGKDHITPRRPPSERPRTQGKQPGQRSQGSKSKKQEKQKEDDVEEDDDELLIGKKVPNLKKNNTEITTRVLECKDKIQKSASLSIPSKVTDGNPVKISYNLRLMHNPVYHSTAKPFFKLEDKPYLFIRSLENPTSSKKIPLKNLGPTSIYINGGLTPGTYQVELNCAGILVAKETMPVNAAPCFIKVAEAYRRGIRVVWSGPIRNVTLQRICMPSPENLNEKTLESYWNDLGFQRAGPPPSSDPLTSVLVHKIPQRVDDRPWTSAGPRPKEEKKENAENTQRGRSRSQNRSASSKRKDRSGSAQKDRGAPSADSRRSPSSGPSPKCGRSRSAAAHKIAQTLATEEDDEVRPRTAGQGTRFKNGPGHSPVKVERTYHREKSPDQGAEYTDLRQQLNSIVDAGTGVFLSQAGVRTDDTPIVVEGKVGVMNQREAFCDNLRSNSIYQVTVGKQIILIKTFARSPQAPGKPRVEIIQNSKGFNSHILSWDPPSELIDDEVLVYKILTIEGNNANTQQLLSSDLHKWKAAHYKNPASEAQKNSPNDYVSPWIAYSEVVPSIEIPDNLYGKLRFLVIAHNEVGYGDWSQPSDVWYNIPYTPIIPTNVRLTLLSGMLEWDGDDNCDKYIVRINFEGLPYSEEKLVFECRYMEHIERLRDMFISSIKKAQELSAQTKDKLPMIQMMQRLVRFQVRSVRGNTKSQWSTSVFLDLSKDVPLETKIQWMLMPVAPRRTPERSGHPLTERKRPVASSPVERTARSLSPDALTHKPLIETSFERKGSDDILPKGDHFLEEKLKEFGPGRSRRNHRELKNKKDALRALAANRNKVSDTAPIAVIFYDPARPVTVDPGQLEKGAWKEYLQNIVADMAHFVEQDQTPSPLSGTQDLRESSASPIPRGRESEVSLGDLGTEIPHITELTHQNKKSIPFYRSRTDQLKRTEKQEQDELLEAVRMKVEESTNQNHFPLTMIPKDMPHIIQPPILNKRRTSKVNDLESGRRTTLEDYNIDASAYRVQYKISHKKSRK